MQSESTDSKTAVMMKIATCLIFFFFFFENHAPFNMQIFVFVYVEHISAACYHRKQTDTSETLFTNKNPNIKEKNLSYSDKTHTLFTKARTNTNSFYTFNREQGHCCSGYLPP